MKKLLVIFTLLVSTLMFSTASYAGWTKVGISGANHFYLDFSSIIKHDGYVYFWKLRDYLKPDKWGDMSSKGYHQVDCILFGYKTLTFSFHKEPMGGGIGKNLYPSYKGWEYPPPNSVVEATLNYVCEYVK